ncbi:Nephronectin [Holothuria leucospilota]|uniref:Nephronectin n=1 Tax=Holothuria leucospilota TaxID=206669 RepID=A0A9Q1HIL9_HOLLE|nr:Nephronectin [Holothuria leucospilota]
MRIAFILLTLFPLFVEYTIAGKVYTVHDYRRVNVNRNTATVRRLGNTYVFPRYRASSRTSVRRCSYGGYSRECCAGWSRNRDGSCSPICTNNCVHGTCVGPDMCKCDKGYTGKSCNRDLNECGLEPRPCDHRCTNTQGSFKCYCERGFILLEDKRTCVRDERCYPGRCSYGCAFNDNEVTCVCPPGLRLIEDGYHCKDIDECAEGLVTCPTDQECKNTFGNYLCVCKEGFQFQYINGKYQCVAAGCESLGYECHQNAYCGYIDLRPECICNEGYWGNGRICLPAQIRDCSSQPCFPGVVCTNEYEDIREISGYPPEGIFDQFKCGPCPPGYRGDGIDCEDIDECTEGTHNCDENAECINEPGSFRCECLEGFHGNGEICVLISPLGCDSCFPGTNCQQLSLPDPNDVFLLSTLDIIYLFDCGPCPPGYEGDGTDCFDVDECAEGTDDCSMNSDCVNDEGSYHCECKEGYHGNGDVCVLISTITCDDQPCFPGVECEDVPLPDSNDVGLLLTLDIIVLYQCGPCPPGYVGDGEMCDDINECEIEPPITNCHVNADCENRPGDYVCMCSDGFFGNGTHCSLLDPRTCDDNPCSPVAECIPIDPDELNFLLPVVQLFECGPCPEEYEGNGYNCTLKVQEIVDPFVNLTVLVLADESPDGDPILSSAFVRTFVSDPTSESGTREHRRARTADNGMAVLECPHNESIIVTANDADYFANSVTFRCNIDQTNAVTLPLHRPYEDTIYVYHPESPRAFGVGNETLNERYSTYFPEDSFNIPDNRKVQLLFRSVNVSVTSELELAPEMIACIPKPPEQPSRGDVGAPLPIDDDVDIRAIETFGAVELTVIDQERRRAPLFKDDKKMVLTFPIQKLPADLSVGDKVPAWTFKFGSGCWEEDGEGELVIDEATGNLVWKYEANHFSWWAAGRVNPRTSCVTVRTCFDEDCSRPAPDTLVRIFGKDYGFETFRYTDKEGQTCVQFPYGRTVELSSPCTGEAIEVESTENPSSCDEGRFEIPKVPNYQMEETQDSCREAVLVIAEYERSCPQPEEVHNNLKLDKNMTRDAYPYTDVVHYSCSDPNDDITTHGLGNRVCTRCYSWTGNFMCEAGEDEEPSYY